jgi:exosome complex component RRP43
MSEFKQISFTPEVLARIAPDVSMQRHLAIGIRPNLRNFTEFNQIEIAPESNTLINLQNKVVGSSVIKSESTTIINTITLGLIENGLESLSQYASVYPVIDILRGRSGAPTDEEMILSQNLYETILHTKILKKESLKVQNLGISVVDELTNSVNIYYPDLHEEFDLLNRSLTNKSYSFVLLSNIKIFSKQISTSSLSDLCYISMIQGLKSIKLPRIYVSDHSSGTKIAVRSRNSTKRGVVGNNSANLNIDLNEQLLTQLLLEDNIGISSNFGAVKLTLDNNNNDDESAEVPQKNEPILLSDLAGEAEESTVLSKMSVITNGDRLKKVSLINGDSNSEMSLDLLKRAIELAKFRAKELL